MDGVKVVLLALFTSVVAAIGTVVVADRYGVLKQAGEAVVPDMRGLSENEARSMAGLARVALFVASREPNSDVRTGTVLRQSIAAGQRVSADAPVSVVLADEMPRVPNVTNVPIADAVRRVEERGYSAEVGTPVPDDKIPLGTVVHQTPKPDTVYAKAGIVVIQPSAGPSEIELPKLNGMEITAAKKKLEDLGLKPIVRWVGMAETPTNVVLNQNPPAGQKVKPGTEVQLTVCMP